VVCLVWCGMISTGVSLTRGVRCGVDGFVGDNEQERYRVRYRYRGVTSNKYLEGAKKVKVLA
jgi:hypothetical protein